MYRTRVAHPFVRELPPRQEQLTDSLWALFVAIGEYWALGDEPEPYRLRLISFMDNRVSFDPIYIETYRKGSMLIDTLVAELGQSSAFEKIFTDRPKTVRAGVPATPLEVLQRFVVDEFIALRLALGSFKAFEALNYPGYIGGANVEGQPIPYRSRDQL